MSEYYPPGVTDDNFDELCWGDTYHLRGTCDRCGDPVPDYLCEGEEILCETCWEQEYWTHEEWEIDAEDF